MSIPLQTTIDSYLAGKDITLEEKEKIILAITDVLYERNQNVIKAEIEKDHLKLEQYLRSIAEYDAIISRRINEIDNGLAPNHTYDF